MKVYSSRFCSLYRAPLRNQRNGARSNVPLPDSSRFIRDFDIYHWLTYTTEMHI